MRKMWLWRKGIATGKKVLKNYDIEIRTCELANDGKQIHQNDVVLSFLLLTLSNFYVLL